MSKMHHVAKDQLSRMSIITESDLIKDTTELKIPLLSEDEISMEIDYTDLPQSCKNRNDMENIRENLIINIQEVQETLERFRAPNQRAVDRLNALKLERQNIKKEYHENREKVREAERNFNIVKMRRTDMFFTFLTRVEHSIDTIYKRLTKSNSAQALLMPQNPEEPYLSGIIYTCIAPGKRALLMSSLSGGEKTMAALALLLAIQKANPAPFFLLDEVDTSLDSANIKKLAEYIQAEKNLIQFIVISLKLKLTCEADELLGITSREGECLQSDIFPFDLEEYEKK